LAQVGRLVVVVDVVAVDVVVVNEVVGVALGSGLGGS